MSILQTLLQIQIDPLDAHVLEQYYGNSNAAEFMDAIEKTARSIADDMPQNLIPSTVEPWNSLVRRGCTTRGCRVQKPRAPLPARVSRAQTNQPARHQNHSPKGCWHIPHCRRDRDFPDSECRRHESPDRAAVRRHFVRPGRKAI